MKVDLHTHTIVSGHAFSTLQENALVASKKGISVLATTDHGPAMFGAPSITYFRCYDRIPKYINGVRILFGVEANIINDNGDIDLPDSVLASLDLVIAGFHYNCGYEDQGVEKNTEVMIKAIKNKYVKVISHPYAKQIKVDIEKVTKAAIENDVLLELNASYFFKNTIDDPEVFSDIKMMINILKKNNKKILINSDAHSSFEVGKFEEVVMKKEELGIKDSDILNNYPEEVLAMLNIEDER